MKFIVFLTVSALASVSMAATCPAGTQKVMTCKSTPKAGENDVSADAFDSILVCSKGAKAASLTMVKDGKSESLDAIVTVRMGGTSYTVETEDVNVQLSVTTGIRSKTSPAQFTLDYKVANMVAKSSYTCSR
jgi:hypothetical protein